MIPVLNESASPFARAKNPAPLLLPSRDFSSARTNFTINYLNYSGNRANLYHSACPLLSFASSTEPPSFATNPTAIVLRVGLNSRLISRQTTASRPVASTGI